MGGKKRRDGFFKALGLVRGTMSEFWRSKNQEGSQILSAVYIVVALTSSYCIMSNVCFQ